MILYEKEMQEMIEKLSEYSLSDNDTFAVGCEQCGKCCRNRNDIILNPLDIFHLVQATGLTVNTVIEKYGETYFGERSNLPLISLKYRENFDGSGTTCYFLGQKDGKFFCRIHDKKPCVCRTYPLGRTLLFQEARKTNNYKPIYFKQENYENFCNGLRNAVKNNQTQTVTEWVGGQEKREIMDRFWEIFSLLLYNLSQIVNLEKVLKDRHKQSISTLLEYFIG